MKLIKAKLEKTVCTYTYTFQKKDNYKPIKISELEYEEKGYGAGTYKKTETTFLYEANTLLEEKYINGILHYIEVEHNPEEE